MRLNLNCGLCNPVHVLFGMDQTNRLANSGELYTYLLSGSSEFEYLQRSHQIYDLHDVCLSCLHEHITVNDNLSHEDRGTMLFDCLFVCFFFVFFCLLSFLPVFFWVQLRFIKFYRIYLKKSVFNVKFC